MWLWANHLISSLNFLNYKIHSRLGIFKVPSSKTHYFVLYSLETSLKTLSITIRNETTYSWPIRHSFIHPFIYSQFTSICYRAGSGISHLYCRSHGLVLFLEIHLLSNPFLSSSVLGHALEKSSALDYESWNMVELRGW